MASSTCSSSVQSSLHAYRNVCQSTGNIVFASTGIHNFKYKDKFNPLMSWRTQLVHAFSQREHIEFGFLVCFNFQSSLSRFPCWLYWYSNNFQIELKTKIFLCIVIANILDHTANEFHVVRDQTLFYLAAKNIAEQSSKILMSRIREKTPWICEHADKLT